MKTSSVSNKKSDKISTKQRIINYAIEMFNTNGVQNVTSRHIAAEMGISHGNLDYHYNTKEDLLLAIYKQMREEMSESYLIKESYSSSIEHLHRLLIHLAHFHLKYKFFHLDLLEIHRSYPRINEILQENLRLRRDQMLALFEKFIDEKYIIGESSDEYIRLRHTIRIVITFWLIQQEVLTSFKFQKEGEMVKHIWELLMPYMTDLGKEEFERVTQRFSFSS
ncbi:transcriptional regulator, TetR family [Zhouia amylolytica]|uniref:Transcriptional regulator, TetR family n=1 Tax=Zhouia amylolytica TaxID=376730 RepID=A0A1I6QY47_9FLAO|nr:TetR/AcrR family transcriptional regulator [Zhouia amylolytica]SFS57431.1 transcriptional regulator, TetR family [Zhouia amylolytica]